MKVLLTGATGFTGSRVLEVLRVQNSSVRCYLRSPAKAQEPQFRGMEVMIGDLADESTFASACKGCDVLLNVASIGFGHAPGIIRAAESAGVRRAVFVSTTAIFTQLNAQSKKVRLEAETAVRTSRLDWTILRPTMIYGSARDRNICRLIRFVRHSPILPVFGSGEFLMQPVHVADLSSAIVKAATADRARGREYNLSGREPLTYNELVQTVSNLMGRYVWVLHLPHRVAIRALRTIERAGLRLPIKAEQIERLNEHKAFAWNEAHKDLQFSPRTFIEGVREEIQSMGFRIAAM